MIPLTNKSNQRGILSLNTDEDDDEWVPPGQAKPVKPEPKPKALMPRPPRPLPKPRKKRKLRRNVIGDDDEMDFGLAPQKVAKRAVLKAKPKPVRPKVVRHKVERDAGLASGLRRRKPMKLHAGEPQPEYVKFKEDLGRSELKKAPEPVLYPVRKELVVESAPIAGKRFGPKHSDLSVRNIRRKRKKKRVDYTKYFDEEDEFDF